MSTATHTNARAIHWGFNGNTNTQEPELRPFREYEENGVTVQVFPTGYARGAFPQRNFAGQEDVLL